MEIIQNVDKPMDRFGFTGGKQYTSEDIIPKISLTIIRQRESKWIEMLNCWNKWEIKKYKKIKERCQKGIPPTIRALAWQYLSGGKQEMDKNRTLFAELSDASGLEQCIEDIKRDVDRQFPHHEFFMTKSGQGQEDLFLVLKAYSIHNPLDGYCQAHAPLAAVLLTEMPAEPAFFSFAAICDNYLPSYYSAGLEIVQIDGQILFGLLKQLYPNIYQHLKIQKIEPILVMTEWFMCIFARTLPWASVLRIWDMFLCEGFKILFLTAIVIIRSCLGQPNQLNSFKSMYETLERLRHIPEEYVQEQYLVTEIMKLNLTDRMLEQEHMRQLAIWKTNCSPQVLTQFKRARLKNFKEPKKKKVPTATLR